MNINKKYCVLQSCYWMMINVGLGYTAFCLGEAGFGAGAIGALTALYGLISALLQPMLGRVADKSRRIGWKTLLLVLSALCAAALAVLYGVSSGVWTAVLFGLIAVLINCMLPMINTAYFYYENKGEKLDFGIARGLGSGAYAVMAMLLGAGTVKFGTGAVPMAGLPVLAVLFLTVWALPYQKKVVQSVRADQEERAVSHTSFVRKYPAFCVMTVGCAILLSVHNLNGTFLIQILERVGGDSSNLGTALAIAAVLEVPVLFFFTHIVKRVPESWLLVISGIAYVGKSLILMLAPNVGMIYVAQLMQPFSYALYASANVYFTNRCMDEEDAATGQALMSMTSPIGSVAGNLLGGWLIDQSGIPLMLEVTCVIAVAAAVVIAAAALMQRKQGG